MDMNNLTKMTDRTPEFDPLDIQNNKAMGILAYIGFLVLVPLLAAPQSKFARYNSSQGLVLFIGELASSVVFGVLGMIPVIGIVFRIIMWILDIAFFGLSVLGIINVASNKAVDLPVAGQIKLIK